MSFFDIRSPLKRRTGTAPLSATEAFQSGSTILQIHAFGSALAGSVQIFGDTNPVTIPANSGWWGAQELHKALTVPARQQNLTVPGVTGSTTSGDTIVFTQVGSYYIEYTDPPGSGGT